MEADPRHTYLFRPVTARPRAEETREFNARLRRAFRAAHGLGISLGLRWISGSEGGVYLTVPSNPGVRWVQFGLSAAYELGQWRLAEEPGPEPDRGPEFAVSLGGPAELPLPSGLDEAPWCEGVLGELIRIRFNVRMEWDLCPDLGAPVVEARPPTPGYSPVKETRASTLPERILYDRQESRRLGLRWKVRGRLVADRDPEALGAASRVARLLEAASHLDGGNRFVCRPAQSPLSRLRSDPVLSEGELVGLFPSPESPGFNPTPADPRGAPQVWLGRDLNGLSVGLPIGPTQGRHLLVLGETGMGKSSLVVRLAWQAARWGSVLLFDPVGDTAREFLSGVPDSQIRQVSWFSPTVPGLTLSLLREIASKSGENAPRRERLLGDVVTALRRVRARHYAESTYWGPRLEEMLFQAIRAASYWSGASLAVAEQLLTPEGFPGRVVPPGARDAVGDVRRRIDRAPQDGDGARRLLSEITRSGVLREMLDSPSPTWSIEEAVEPERITVVSGEAPHVGESVARYLLSVVLALAWNAVLVRGRPSKTFLVLDEAQWYAHDSVAEMLRLGRRFNLHVWAVTQSLQSLPEVVRDAFTTNSADLVLFRGDPSDAKDVSRWVPQIAPERILRMPKGEAAVLIDKGSETRWVHLPVPTSGRGDPNRFQTAVNPSEFREASGEPAAGTDSRPELVLGRMGVTRTEDSAPLLEALGELLDGPQVGSDLTVRLSELRARWHEDPTLADRCIRNGGRFLSATGALLQTGRDTGGSFWVVSRERLVDILSHGSTARQSGATPEARLPPNGGGIQEEAN
jgi:hypothetical protein